MIAPQALLLLPRLRVQNANAISSPLTWGFPSPSAFTGFAHALERRVGSDFDLAFEGVAIVCHDFEAQASSPAGRRTKVFHLTRNPVDRNGDTAAIVEEGRAHMTASLLIGVNGDGLFSGSQPSEIAAAIHQTASSMRLAGGSILPDTRLHTSRNQPTLEMWPATPEDERKLSRRLARRLLPGFALVSREHILEERWKELKNTAPEATTLDALLDLSSVNYEPPQPKANDENGPADDGARRAEGEHEWTIRRKGGWLVPIAAGYRAISEVYAPGSVQNARDRSAPFCFVEGIYTLGQWLSPHRVDDIRKLLWVHASDAQAGIYRWSTPYFSTTLNKRK